MARRMELFMIQTEERQQQIGEPTISLNEVKTGKRSRKSWLLLAITVIAVAALLISGIWYRVKARTALNTETAQAALTAVSVVSPKQTAPADEIILPGNVQPFINSPIYSRTNGYLKKWYFDIGAHVKKGQLLAVVDTPEVDQQLQQSLMPIRQMSSSSRRCSLSRRSTLRSMES